MDTDCGMREDGEQEYARFGGVKYFGGYTGIFAIYFWKSYALCF